MRALHLLKITNFIKNKAFGLFKNVFIGGLLILICSSCGENESLKQESPSDKEYLKFTPEISYISKSCEEISKHLNTQGQQKSDIWKSYENQKFKWHLELVEISEKIIGKDFVVKFKCHGSNGYFSNIKIIYPERAKNKLLQMQKGSFYIVTGQLKSYFQLGNGFNALPISEEGDFLKEPLKGNPLSNTSYITESCSDLSRKLGSKFLLTQFQKKELLKNLKGKVFVWNLEFRRGILGEHRDDVIAQFRCKNSGSYFLADIIIVYPKAGETEILNMKKGSFYKIKGWFKDYNTLYGVIEGVSQQEMLKSRK